MEQTPATPPAPPPPAQPGIPLGAVIAVALFALAGVALLGYAVFSLLKTPAPAPATATQVAVVPSPLALPTTTPAPTVIPPTATLAPPTDTAAPTAVASARLTINVGANVRSGPGTLYPILGGANAGEQFDVVGKDASAQWFVINYSTGQGWIAAFVTTFSGDLNSLPIIAAPPPPPTAVPTDTPRPAPTNPPAPVATSTPAGYFSHGIQGVSFSVENTTAGVGQDVWFNFKVVNTSEFDVQYSVLAAHTDNSANAKSWTNETLKAKAVLEWRDHINFPAKGTFSVYLGICYGGKDACLANQVGWDRLSPSVTVTIQ